MIVCVKYHSKFTTHVHCGFATGFYAINMTVSAGKMLAFTYHSTFTYLRAYSILPHLRLFQIYNLMKFDSFSRFLKSELYNESLMAEMNGKPIRLDSNGKWNPESGIHPHF